MTRLLLIHTAGPEGTVALAEVMDGDSRVVGRAVLPGRSSSERLVPEVRGLLEGAGWRLGELAAVVVVHGPGSFTGVRVGLSAAKGFSEAVAVPLVVVSRLALLAAAGAATLAEQGVVHAVLDAGRGEFYYGAYERGRCLREALLTGAEVRAAVGASGSGRVVACEAGVGKALGGLQVCMVGEPVAEDAVRIAWERLRLGQVDDAATVDANYLRRTDFEIKAKLAIRAEAAASDSAGRDASGRAVGDGVGK